MWQHSRMFGYDRDPGMMRVYIDEPLYKLFSDINATNTILLDDRVTMVKMAEQTGLSRATVERVVKTMKEKQIIGRVGSTKNGNWIIHK